MPSRPVPRIPVSPPASGQHSAAPAWAAERRPCQGSVRWRPCLDPVPACPPAAGRPLSETGGGMDLVLVLVGVAHLERACQEAVLAQRGPELLRLIAPALLSQVFERNVAEDPGMLRVRPLGPELVDHHDGIRYSVQELAQLLVVGLPQVPVHDRAYCQVGQANLDDGREQPLVRGITVGNARALLHLAVGLIAERDRALVKLLLVLLLDEKVVPEQAQPADQSPVALAAVPADLVLRVFLQERDVGAQPGRIRQLRMLRTGNQRFLADVRLSLSGWQGWRPRPAIRGEPGRSVPGLEAVSGGENGVKRLQDAFPAEPHLRGQPGQPGKGADVVLQPVEVVTRFPIGDGYL